MSLGIAALLSTAAASAQAQAVTEADAPLGWFVLVLAVAGVMLFRRRH